MKQLWYRRDRLLSDNSSPVVYDGRTYTIQAPAILCCADAATGDRLWQLRLKGPLWASAVVAGGHLYCVNHGGLVQVVQLGDKGKLVGTSRLDSTTVATPAIADGAIYFRSDEHLWKIEAIGAAAN